VKPAYDLVCVAHLRWDFVFQRPQHLMTRAAAERRVFYVEEPVFEDGAEPRLETRRDASGVVVVVPVLPHGLNEAAIHGTWGQLLAAYLDGEGVSDYALWIYSPMPLPALRNLKPKAVVYDCMDELANFRFAPPELRLRERELFGWADLVFTGGYSLWEAKRHQHASVHAFPSSVDVAHFAQARGDLPEPADLTGVPQPRIGFYGVIDERMDIELLAHVAVARPEWQLVVVGPVVKIDPAELPRPGNIHYLGQKSYAELPSYLAHWDVAMLPFALNESTEFISPTKTPEYLAAGKPVVSTAIRDVVRPYAEKDLVLVGRDRDGFVAAIEEALKDSADRRARADAFVGLMSWDRLWRQMNRLIGEAVAGHTAPQTVEPVLPKRPTASVLKPSVVSSSSSRPSVSARFVETGTD